MSTAGAVQCTQATDPDLCAKVECEEKAAYCANGVAYGAYKEVCMQSSGECVPTPKRTAEIAPRPN